jgi:hypothetical protein
MRNRIRKYALVASTAVMGVLVFAGSSLASATYPLTGVTTGFTAQLSDAVTTALPIAGPIIALFVGWRVFKRLVKG